MVSKKVALTAAIIVTGALATLGLLNGAATGAILGSVTLPNVGTIKAVGVGVYWDSNCNNPVSSIDWGSVEAGSATDATIYIKNEGTASVTLSSETENWNPSTAASYMNLTWDYGGQVIDVDAVAQVTMTLSVSDSIQGITSFSFDIVIIGSG